MIVSKKIGRLNRHLHSRVERSSQNYEALANRQQKLYITRVRVSKKIKQKLARLYRSITRFDLFVKQKLYITMEQQKTLHNYAKDFCL